MKLWRWGKRASGERVDVRDAKNKLKALRAERNILSQVLLMIYENKDLPDREKEGLLEKYKKELKDVDAKIESYSAFVELEELSEMKEQLVNMLQTKISDIDRRINELRSKLAQPEQQVEPAKQEPLQEEQKGEGEQEIEELYKQVNEILKKLENVEE